MSFYYINYLSKKKNGDIFMTVADSRISPRKYYTGKALNLNEENLEYNEWLKRFSISIRDGNYKIVGSKCDLLNTLKEAREIMQLREIDRIITDEDYGTFSVNYTKQPQAAITELEKKLDTFYTTEYLKKTLIEWPERWMYLPINITRNKELAKIYVDYCADHSMFMYPTILVSDREYVLKAIKARGVNFRTGPDMLWKNDREIVMTAFTNPSWPEHLPDLIGKELLKVEDFLLELIEKCPKLHFDRFPWETLHKQIVVDALSKHNVWYKARLKKQTLQTNV